MSFWDVVWFIVISFAFIAYLMVMFSIITDLFRDREQGGFAKAVWVIALIFLPFLTALVYLIARGGGMSDRAQRDARIAQAAQEDYIRSVARPEAAPADQIAQARALQEAGAISAAEFEKIKAKVLA